MIPTIKKSPASEISEHARIKLCRLIIHKLNDNDYDVMKVGYRTPRTVIATRKLGVEVINLFKKGCTIKGVREILSQRYNCTAERIQITPLIESLLKARMIKSINGKPVIPDQLNLPLYIYLLSRMQLNKAARFLYTILIENLLPVTIIYPILAKIVFSVRTLKNRKKVAPFIPLVIRNLKQTFPSVKDAELAKIAQEYWDNKLKIGIDYQLLGKSMKVFPHWLKAFSSCTGIEYLEGACEQKRGVLLCGFHFGFMFLIPLVLITFGYNITVIGYTGRNFDSNFYAQLNETFKKAGFGEFNMRNLVDLKGLASIVKLLENGGIVLIMADANMAAVLAKTPDIGKYMGSDTINYRPAQTKVNILGHSISGNKGIAWLHRQTGAPIVPVRMFRTGKNRQELIIRPALNLDDGNGKYDIEQSTHVIYTALEREVYDNPAQWIYWNRIHEM